MTATLRTCDLDALERFVVHSAGPAASIAIDGVRFARIDLLIRLLASRMPAARFSGAAAYSSDDGDDVDLRIWMDDPGGAWAHAQEVARSITGSFGWTATLSAEEESRMAERKGQEKALRQRADVVFAALEGFDDVVHLRLMAEVGADFALWDDGNHFLGELEGLLPIHHDLAQRLRRWAVATDLDWTEDGEREGRQLANELRRELGPRYVVESANPVAGRHTRRPPERPTRMTQAGGQPGAP